jgi:hypothetical protein
MNAQQIIESIRGYRDAHFEKDDPMRLEYQIACLETKVTELCFVFNNTVEAIREIQREMDAK